MWRPAWRSALRLAFGGVGMVAGFWVWWPTFSGFGDSII